MLTNPMETQFVSSMGVKIGGREIPAQPMEVTRSGLEGGGRRPSPKSTPRAVQGRRLWSGAPRPSSGSAGCRASSRGMVKRIYTDYARDRRIRTLTPEVMDTARSELGLEGM